MPDARWYFAVDGKPKGPVSEAELRVLLTKGVVSLDALVWTETLVGWTPASEIERFRPAVTPPPAPPPVPPPIPASQIPKAASALTTEAAPSSVPIPPFTPPPAMRAADAVDAPQGLLSIHEPMRSGGNAPTVVRDPSARVDPPPGAQPPNVTRGSHATRPAVPAAAPKNEAFSHAEGGHSVAGIDESNKFLGGTYYPWRRFFARFVDTCTFGLLTGFALVVGLVLLLPEKAGGLFSALDNPFIGGPIILALWIPIEAVLLSTVGNTPARWIFGISVRTPSGHKPSFGQALMRSFGVCVQGVGLGIPFIAFFTQFFAYRRLTRTGTTLWDSSAGCAVTHKTWGTGRTVVCVVVVLFVVVLLSVLNAGSK
jgi:hypothetical protein